MEQDTLQQKLQLAIDRFPIDCKVCNYKVGSVGIVCDAPFVDLEYQKVFLPVIYGGNRYYEDVDQIFVVNTIKKGVKRRE